MNESRELTLGRQAAESRAQDLEQNRVVQERTAPSRVLHGSTACVERPHEPGVNYEHAAGDNSLFMAGCIAICGRCHLAVFGEVDPLRGYIDDTMPAQPAAWHRPGTFAKVTPSGGLAVDVDKLLSDPKVQSDIATLSKIPLDGPHPAVKPAVKESFTTGISADQALEATPSVPQPVPFDWRGDNEVPNPPHPAATAYRPVAGRCVDIDGNIWHKAGERCADCGFGVEPAATVEEPGDGEMLDWWEGHLNYEHGVDYESGEVVLYRVTGNINDREWHEVSRARALRDAIRAAMRDKANG
jgi:hypothetical protein